MAFRSTIKRAHKFLQSHCDVQFRVTFEEIRRNTDLPEQSMFLSAFKTAYFGAF